MRAAWYMKAISHWPPYGMNWSGEMLCHVTLRSPSEDTNFYNQEKNQLDGCPLPLGSLLYSTSGLPKGPLTPQSWPRRASDPIKATGSLEDPLHPVNFPQHWGLVQRMALISFWGGQKPQKFLLLNLKTLLHHTLFQNRPSLATDRRGCDAVSHEQFQIWNKEALKWFGLQRL